MPAAKLIHTLLSKSGMTDPQYRSLLRERFGVSSSKELSPDDCRMLASILRGMSDRQDQTEGNPVNLSATSRKIWQQFYQLRQMIGHRSAKYLAGIIGKVCGDDCSRGITDGARIDLDRLTPQQAYKVIEALKQRIEWQDTGSCRTVPSLEARARASGLREPQTTPDCPAIYKEEEELNARLAEVPF